MKSGFRENISCVDLFCGAGGLTYGFGREGLQVNAGIDLDPACHYPFSSNNDSTFIERDISEIDATEMLKLFSPNTIWVLAGCAPCQPFSTYSQRYDTRMDYKWGLLYEFERLIEGVIPDIVTMENVPKIKHHKVFNDFIKTLERLGYEVWHDVVDCAAYGVPQSRKRMVLLASLHGAIGLIEPIKDESNYPTVRQAIGRLHPISAGESDIADKMHVASTLSAKNMDRIRASKPGGTWRDWPQHLVANCHKADSGYTYPSVYGRMEWDKPAPTITTQFYGFGNGRFGHPEQDRALSLREAAILQGFPKSYKFVPPREEVYIRVLGRLIGNAVPVGLGRAIAKSIIRHIDDRDIRPKRSARIRNQKRYAKSSRGPGRVGTYMEKEE
jgi:DNA (cytosine-5)-methyltransferase 1